MFTISSDQWQKLEARRRNDFIRQLTTDLIARFGVGRPAMALDDIQAQVEQIVRVGEAWGMQSSRVLTQHVLASRVIGHDYADVVLETGNIVRSNHLDDDTKARWLELWLESIRQHAMPAR